MNSKAHLQTLEEMNDRGFMKWKMIIHRKTYCIITLARIFVLGKPVLLHLYIRLKFRKFTSSREWIPSVPPLTVVESNKEINSGDLAFKLMKN
jgi:hypothetical protein